MLHPAEVHFEGVSMTENEEPSGEDLLTKLCFSKYVIACELPIEVSDYNVDFILKNEENKKTSTKTEENEKPETKTEKTVVQMISRFTIENSWLCWFPLCCVTPCFNYAKTVTDDFYVDTEEKTLTLKYTNAFSCCTWCGSKMEEGKVFHILNCNSTTQILVCHNEILVCSSDNSPRDDDFKIQVNSIINESGIRAKNKFELKWL